MTIREATAQDTERLASMAARFLESTAFGRLFVPDVDRLAALVEACLAHGAIYVAEDRGGLIVGMLGFGKLEHPWSGEAFVEEQAWWVEPEYRGGLVGVQLLAKLETWAIAHGVRLVKVGAPASSSIGAAYEKLGYRAIETAYVKELPGGTPVPAGS